jgi:hypothetical protein
LHDVITETDPKENTASDPLLLHDIITGTDPKENTQLHWLLLRVYPLPQQRLSTHAVLPTAYTSHCSLLQAARPE